MQAFPMFDEEKQVLHAFCSRRKAVASRKPDPSALACSMVLYIEELHQFGVDDAPNKESQASRSINTRAKLEPLLVLLDGDRVFSSSCRGNRTEVPSGLMFLTPRAMSSRLQMRLSSQMPLGDKDTASGGSCAENLEVLEIQASMTELASFGAPLYTSLWLGFAASGEKTSFAECVSRARWANGPKIKVTIFDQAFLDSLPPTISYKCPRPHVRRGVIADTVDELSCFGRTARNGPSLRSGLEGVEGLMKCLDESNTTVGVLLSSLELMRQQQQGHASEMRQKNHEIDLLNQQLKQVSELVSQPSEQCAAEVVLKSDGHEREGEEHLSTFVQEPQAEPTAVFLRPSPSPIVISSCTTSPCVSPAPSRRSIRLPTFGATTSGQVSPRLAVQQQHHQDHRHVQHLHPPAASFSTSNAVMTPTNHTSRALALRASGSCPSNISAKIVSPRHASIPQNATSLHAHQQAMGEPIAAIPPMASSSPCLHSKCLQASVTQSAKNTWPTIPNVFYMPQAVKRED